MESFIRHDFRKFISKIELSAAVSQDLFLWLSLAPLHCQKQPPEVFYKKRCFFVWVFFHEHSPFTGQQERGEGISLIPLYQFHPLHRHLDISREITKESSPMYVCKIYLTSVKNVVITKSSIYNTNLNRPRQILFVTS